MATMADRAGAMLSILVLAIAGIASASIDSRERASFASDIPTVHHLGCDGSN